jgi:hypothetical protein
MQEMDRKLEFLKGIMQMISDSIKIEEKEDEEELEYLLNPNLLHLKRKSRYIKSFLKSIRGNDINFFFRIFKKTYFYLIKLIIFFV